MSLTVGITGLHAGENPQPGVGVMRSLRRAYNDITIIGLVYDVLESGAYAPDGPDAVFEFPYPSAGGDAVLERLDYISDRYPLDILMPTLDAEILPLINLGGALAGRGIKTMLPTVQAFKARGKAGLPKLAEASGCRTPQTVDCHDIDTALKAAKTMGYPLMIKGQYYEAYQVRSDAELVAQYHAIINKWGTPVMVQAFVAGSEFDVVAVGDGEGGVGGYCTVRKTIVSEKGKGYGAVVVRDDELNRQALAIIAHLRWRGPMELEFVQESATGDFYLLEINPRFPAWVDFPSAFGHNLPALVVDALLHGKITPLPDYPVGKFFLRHCVDLACDIEDMGKLSALGEWIKT